MVRIYIETDNHCPKRMLRESMAIIECDTQKGPAQIGFLRHENETFHQNTLNTLRKALERLNRPCEIQIYIQNAFVANAIVNHLPKWRKDGFQNSIKNKEEWQELDKLLSMHKVRVECGKHSYTQWMRWRMGKEQHEKEESKE